MPARPFRDAVKRLTDGRGADVVFDPVGGEIFENSLRCIRLGRACPCGRIHGGIGLARTNLLLIRRERARGSRRRSRAAKSGYRRGGDQGVVGVGGGGEDSSAYLAPVADEDFAQAMRLLIDRKAIGRVALMMG